ncbi:hypothetical protein [Kitasatospora purpeofusca]|uniref:hypothetical protein n=1 Tax=Kitasatospora purpeofusca TaxID=67352 RepID=UPI002258953E|nr:hypothetical protein [Kitasatospora purpeofusca]MCX4755134.1 hypothetical protein [Kitasatospora purpeofusca]WSR36976.1 hypothetical protein OG715_42045 [Kitasatospora purpeofusca]WSR37668.1 hypothetical protein OG196_00325 [Kitasatospora purpeofusca]
MSIQWDLDHGADLLRLSGCLGQDALHRFTGAVDWTRAHRTGPVILDLSALRGWNTEGEAAIVDAAARLGAHHGPPAVCGLGDRVAPLIATAHALGSTPTAPRPAPRPPRPEQPLSPHC